ncbi:hypothetical protein NX059_001857 [Plenodomus lindquistii]|nr:hypothetical protein NX059_001857 [Plenodomus lindquistii]
MQFTSLFLGASAAALSAAAPAPVAARAASEGSWNVTINQQWASSGFNGYQVHANFTSPTYPAGIVKSCAFNDIPNQPETFECDPGLNATLAGTTLYIAQNVDLPTPTTFYGEKSFEFVTSLVGKSSSAHGIVEVKSSAPAPAPLATRDFDEGTWDIVVDQQWASNGWKAHQVYANFTSTSYPGSKGIVSSCKYDATPEKPVVKECTPGFSYDMEPYYTSIKVQQNIDLPNPSTVFGEAPINFVTGGVGKSATARVTVAVSAAIA